MVLIKELDDILSAAVAATPPDRIYIFDLRDLLIWFEANLCLAPLTDPRKDRVRFECERFPYLIKLCHADGRSVKKPKKEVEKIRSGNKARQDYGEPHVERTSTLSWLSCCITNPTVIIKNRHPHVPGHEVYVKKFQKSGLAYKEVVCLRFRTCLVPVTSFLSKKPTIHCPEDILWPK